jgi:hypothetical protein
MPSSSWGRSRASAAAAEEAMRLELDVKLKARELQLLSDIVAGARGLTPLITELGVLSKLVLAGAGGLVFIWGLSKFCATVVLPFLPSPAASSSSSSSSSSSPRRRRLKGGSSPPASP